MASVLCVGLMIADVFARPVRRLPPSGTADHLDTAAIHPGGDALNNAMALGRLGTDVTLVGRVGADPFGDFTVREAERVGVSVSAVRDTDAPTSICLVLVFPGGEHSFLYCPGANRLFSLADIPRELVEKASIIHVGSACELPALDGKPMGELFRTAREAGTLTCADVCEVTQEERDVFMAEVIPLLDFFLPSELEGRLLTGRDKPEEMADALLDAGAAAVVVKTGAKGCHIRTRAERLDVPAYRVDVVDTTGAGDCFVAGFLTGVLQEWDLEKCGRFASAVAACCVGTMGANAGVKSIEATLEFMEKHG